MNMIVAALVLLATPALAQTQRLEPAPVPDREVQQVNPAERAGRPDGSERAAPFSGLPNTLGAGTGQDTPATLGNSSTRTAPAPNLSR